MAGLGGGGGFSAGKGFTSGINKGGGGGNVKPPRAPMPTKPKGGGGGNIKPPAAPKGGGKGTGNKGGGGGKGGKGKGGGKQAPYFTPQEQRGATAIANAQTRDPITELSKQVATNRTSNQAGQKVDFGYYMQLAQAAKNAVGQQGQIGAGLNTTLAGIGANAQQTLGQLGQQQQQGAVGRFNALGLGGDSAAQLAATTAQQQGVGALNSQAFQQAGALQGANYQSNAANERGVVSLAGTEQIGNLARAGALANQPLNAKIAGLKASKGALRATALSQLRQQDVTNQFTAQGLGIKSATLQQQAKQFAQSQATTRRGQTLSANVEARRLQIEAGANRTRANYDAGSLAIRQSANRIAQYKATHPASRASASSGGGGARPLTTNENNEVNASLGRIISLVQQAQQHFRAGNKQFTEKFIRQSLASGNNPSKKSYSPVLVEAAYELLGYGSIDRQTAGQLHAMGVRGTTFRGRPVKVTHPSNASGASNAVGNAAAGRPAGGLF